MKIKNFRKLNIKAMILCLTASAFTMSVLLPTMSWFNADTSSPISVDGNIHGSYFESGDGTAANPFEIARPIQLYYLSWLQEMGYFNEAEEHPAGSGQYRLKQQYHFYLSKDLNLNDTANNETYILPPIGTIKYPFIGSFDGKGHVISNLTITNAYNTYTKDPRHPSGSTNPDAHSDSYEILGLFGVLGTTESTNDVSCSIIEADGTIHQLQDNGGDNILISYNDGETYNYVQNTYLDNITIIASTDSDHALAGAVAGYSNATVSNIGIKGATLTFANGTESVGDIGTTNLSDYTSFGFVTADHKRTVDIINEQVYNPKATAKTFTNNSTGTAWGGSVDMATLLKRTVKSQYISGSKNDNTVPNYPKKETYVYDGDTLLSHDITYDNKHFSKGGSNYNQSGYYSSDKTANEGSDETIGSYYIVNHTTRNDDNIDIDGHDSYHKAYLGGMTNISGSTSKEVYYFNYNNEPETCYYIRSDSGTGNNFIGINENGTINKQCSKSSAVKWHLVNGALKGHAKIRDITTSVTNSPSEPREQIYYLNYSTDFSIGTSSTTSWTYSNGQIKLSGSGSTYTIKQNGANNYFSNSGTNVGNQNSLANATKWTLSDAPTDGAAITISANISSRTRYVRIRNDRVSVTLSTTQYSCTVTKNSDGTFYLYNGRYYLIYSNGWTSTNSATRTKLDIELYEISFNVETDTEKPFTLSEPMIERSGQAGYIPLACNGDSASEKAAFDETNTLIDPFSYKDDTTNLSDFCTSPINTGYVVGGYYDETNGGSESSKYTNFGDVRIAQYSHYYVCGSYDWTTHTYGTLYTINNDSNGNSQLVYFNQNGNTTDANGNTTSSSKSLNFVKLSAALRNYNKTLQGGEKEANKKSTHWISGIHFMSSTISKERTIIAEKVLINREIKRNYEMPEDSIDFHLKEKGYINFFAGNYHEKNDSFFTLHKIERNPDDSIKSIRKIKKIFKNKDDLFADHIYLFNDADEETGSKWSDNSNRSENVNSFTVDGQTYEFAFDTKWIGQNTNLIPRTGGGKPSTNNTSDLDYKRIYYFEIPVNEGEYALGSCDTGCGAYLTYLDISSAAQTINRKTVNEMFNVNTISGDIPYGTQYVSSYSNAVITHDENGDEVKDAIVRTGINNIDDLDSYYGSISTSANGSYTIDRSTISGQDTITVSGTNALTTSYIGEGINLVGRTLSGRTQRRIRRITDYDYNTITHQYVIQTTTIVIEGTGSTAHNAATTTIEYNEDGFDHTFTKIATYSYDWIGDGPSFSYTYFLHTTNASNGIELVFQNHDTVNKLSTLTVEYLANDFMLTCGTNPITLDSQTVSAGVSSGTFATLEIPITTEPYDADVWYDFGNSPTIDCTFDYIREGTQVVTENFVFSGYECLEDIQEFPEEEEEEITIEGSYTYEFNLSGSTTTFTVYYLSNGTVVVQAADGSQTITFVNKNQSNP